jgi:nicotinate phosphoribosyltransferase
MRLFHVALDEEVKNGGTTDIYFVRTEEILKNKGLEKVEVVTEVTTGKLPRGWPWAVLCGIDEEARLFEGYPINVYSMPEGTIFHAKDFNGVRVPVMALEGPYANFCKLETPLLGLICQASGIATAAARIRRAAGEKLVTNFGARRMHPSLSPFIGRAAYIGGVDGISSLAAAKLLGLRATGTMPHALIIVFGNQVNAWKAFDDVVSEEVPRIALVDTYYDEKVEAVMAAKALEDHLWGVRLDTPSSRKGDFAEIVKEVRWELDLRGYRNVKIFVSGGLNEESVKVLSEAGAEGFGVGTWISNSPVVDFAMDIVEINGRPVAKRGKLGGRKQVWRCPQCLVDTVLPYNNPPPLCPICGGGTEPMLRPLIRNGEVCEKPPKPREVREFVLKQLKKSVA